MASDLLNGLNPQQAQAVTAATGPLLILAGPGSGKTGVLTRRIAYLIREQGVKPWHIMAVTFTNKAAAEMRHRVQNLLGEQLQGLQIGTFHATCARILRIEHAYTPYGQDFIIYDSDDQVSAVNKAMGELNIDTRKFSPRRVLNAISNAKNELIMPAEYEPGDYFSEIVARVYPRYQLILQDSNALDFDDLLVQMVLALQKHDDLREKYQTRYQHVLVDEFQDTNMTQYKLVQLFGNPQNNVFAVGDEDQSIYAFRGADYRNVQRFREDFADAEVILLEQNYRSTQVVLDIARAVIDRNFNRTPKALFTDRDGGNLVRIYEASDQDDEAQYIMQSIQQLCYEEDYEYSDFAIMYRTNVQSRVLEKACRDYAIPYQLVGGVGFYKRMEVRDLLAYLRLVNNPDDSMAFSRIINVPRRGIGKKSQQQFVQYAANFKLSYSQVFEQLCTGEQTTITGRAFKPLKAFATMLDDWRDRALHGDLVELFDTIRSDIEYTLHLRDYCKTPDEFNDRMENIQELRDLLQQAQDHDVSLGEFLAEQTLMTDTTDNKVEDNNAVTLLTLHAAKGLEYPVVFITGIENDLLPHARSKGEDGDYNMDSEDVAEERRLFYVGITRAKDILYLTYAVNRFRFGTYRASEFSVFLADVPESLVRAMPRGLSGYRKRRGYRRATTWENQPSDPPPHSPLAKLKRDMEEFRASIEKQNEALKQTSHESPPPERKVDFSSKIIPFPGGVGEKPFKYRRDQRVYHPVFGQGVVLNSYREGRDEFTTVKFENNHGIRKIMVDMIEMDILD